MMQLIWMSKMLLPQKDGFCQRMFWILGPVQENITIMYGISNKNLMYKMIDLMATHQPEEILAMNDVKQRVDRYLD